MIGIRREDKNRWEARVPLIPADVERLRRDHHIPFCVQPSPIRAFADIDYASAGGELNEDLGGCSVVLGIKEIPVEHLAAERTYVYFSHTIKGQPGNMPMLQRLMELNCQLIDYERIVDSAGRRQVLFGNFAGLAGMIDGLWALGQRWRHEGANSPFSSLQQAHHYGSLEEAKSAVAAVGRHIRETGLPPACQPMVCGFAGYGQVSTGAQEIYDLLPVEEVAPQDIAAIPKESRTCFKVVFHEEHMVERVQGSAPFELQEYYDHPQHFRGRFSDYLPHLTVLVNAIYWTPDYPRLVTRDAVRTLYSTPVPPRLRVVADISCDIAGSIECTVRATEPGNPVYVFDPRSGQAHDGVAGRGPVIMAVDNLPCELPVESSAHFSQALSPFIPALHGADFRADLGGSGLPPELVRATIVYHGRLTEPYRYLEDLVAP